MIKTVTPQELRKAFDAANWNDYTLIETLPDGSEILVCDIFAAIAAAVQAEREACAKRLEELAEDGERAVAIMARLGYETHESYLAEAMRFGAAAIRARNGGK